MAKTVNGTMTISDRLKLKVGRSNGEVYSHGAYNAVVLAVCPFKIYFFIKYTVILRRVIRRGVNATS